MSNNTARLVDALAIGSHGTGVSATLARGEFEEALKAGRGPVELSIDMKRLSGGQPDVEAHTLDVALERRELKKLLKKSDGDAITLTFDEDELLEALGGDDDVEAHGVRERALVLTVAAATAAAGTGAYVASTMGHHASSPTETYAQQVSAAATGGYLTAAAAQALGVSVQPVSDAATGGYTAPAIDTTVQAVPPIDAGSALSNPALIPEQVSDAASGGGYGSQTSEAQGVSAASTGGYVTAAQGKAIADAEAQGVSAASTGYEAPTPRSGAGTDQSDAVSRYLANQTPEQVSDAATSGPVTHQSDAVSRYVANQTPEQVSDAATSGPVTDQSDAVSRYVANTQAGPEQVSDAASGGGFPTQHAEAQRTSVTLPEAVGAAIAGGAALLITGVALQRRR